MNAAPPRPDQRQRLLALALATAACAGHGFAGSAPFTPGRGRIIWTDSVLHDPTQPAYHSRCGSVLHLWVQDTRRIEPCEDPPLPPALPTTGQGGPSRPRG